MTGLHRRVAPSERISPDMSLGTTVRCVVYVFPLPERLKEVLNEDFYLSLIEALSHWIVLQSDLSLLNRCYVVIPCSGLVRRGAACRERSNPD